MNRRKDIFIFAALLVVGTAVSIGLALWKQHTIPVPRSDLWPKLTACTVDKHYLEGKYRIYYTPEVKALDGKSVQVDGFLLPLETEAAPSHFLLSVRAPSCPYCPPAGPNELVEIMTKKPFAWSDQLTSMRGTLQLMPEASREGIFFKLTDAAPAAEYEGTPMAEVSPSTLKALREYRFQEVASGADITLQNWQGKPLLVMFWRDDCPPCRIELKNLPTIAKQHPALTIALISLDGTLKNLPPLPSSVHVLMSREEAKALLASFGNQKLLALPYSAMLQPGGGICATNNGILTPRLVTQWTRLCTRATQL